MSLALNRKNYLVQNAARNGAPDTTSWEYSMCDHPWTLEIAKLFDDIRLNREPAAGLADASAALTIV